MADNVQDATHEILKGIQASIVELRASTEASIGELRRDIGRQFESFAQEARADRRRINGLMAIVQSVSGDFDERIREMDDRVSALEDRAS
jgi:hypothetical protein